MLSLVVFAAVACTPLRSCVSDGDLNCATPTPMLRWDYPSTRDALDGFDLYSREDGGPMLLASTLPCDFYDADEDGVKETRLCRGLDFGIPVQRYCASCAPYGLREFAVKAKGITGVASAFSSAVSICMSPECDLATRGQCN